MNASVTLFVSVLLLLCNHWGSGAEVCVDGVSHRPAVQLRRCRNTDHNTCITWSLQVRWCHGSR